MKALKSIFPAFGARLGSAAQSVKMLPPTPARPTYVVGDIHGRADLMYRLLENIDDDITAKDHRDPQLIFVGDYVDRGEESAKVLKQLKSWTDELPGFVVCLMGNHERMMLDFLDRPLECGPRWLRYGGLQTLASFGLKGITENAATERLAGIAGALRASLPSGLEGWMRELPLSWQSGNVVVVHAAMDPDQKFDEQRDKHMLWGHPEFLKRPHMSGQHIVHGHTVVDTAEVIRGRIPIDTGGYFSGRLTAVALSPDHAPFFLHS